MKFPPEPKTEYVMTKPQYKRIFDKLSQFQDKKLSGDEEKLVKFLYSQLESNWEDPLEEFVDKMLRQ